MEQVLERVEYLEVEGVENLEVEGLESPLERPQESKKSKNIPVRKLYMFVLLIIFTIENFIPYLSNPLE
jgi:hypothetical protein